MSMSWTGLRADRCERWKLTRHSFTLGATTADVRRCWKRTKEKKDQGESKKKAKTARELNKICEMFIGYFIWVRGGDTEKEECNAVDDRSIDWKWRILDSARTWLLTFISGVENMPDFDTFTLSPTRHFSDSHNIIGTTNMFIDHRRWWGMTAAKGVQNDVRTLVKRRIISLLSAY